VIVGGEAPPREPGASLESDLITPRQRRLVGQLEDRARRIELLAALTTAGGLPIDRAAGVLGAELGELATSAGEAELTSLGAMARATRRLVEQLGGVASVAWPQREVVVLDDNEVTRDLVTLALQAEGHHVRAAACVAELSSLVRERKPHVVLTEARMPEAPGARFCHYLRQLMALEQIPIVLFSSTRGDELAALAREAGANLWLSKDQGISDLMSELARLFDEIVW
jgi:CheY-like chemotaxis protein